MIQRTKSSACVPVAARLHHLPWVAEARQSEGLPFMVHETRMCCSLPTLPVAHQPFHLLVSGVKAQMVADGNLYLVRASGLEDQLRHIAARSHGLFEEDVLAGASALNRVQTMQTIRRGDDHRIEIFVGGEGIEVGVSGDRGLRTMFVGEGLGLFEITPEDTPKHCTWNGLECGNQAFIGDLPGGQSIRRATV